MKPNCWRACELRWRTWTLSVVTGQGARNRFGIDGWALPTQQQFQFGDLRIELPATTVLVETESAGGVGNLVKYWPLLRSRALAKSVVIIYLYMLSSEGDYIAHRKLWSFLFDRINTDLNEVGVGRPDAWDAHFFTYCKGQPPNDVTAFLRATVAGGLAQGRTPSKPTGLASRFADRQPGWGVKSPSRAPKGH